MLKDQKEDRKADVWAEKFSNELFRSQDIGVMQANFVYKDIKKIVLEAILKTNEIRKK
tara:strand:- start:1000 stop:1173 length:174 start_codon:yes stop_codon:yes gene_type:complete